MKEINLNEEEQRLYYIVLKQCNDQSYDKRLEAFEASNTLVNTLFERDAIPEVRIRYFVDPNFNTGRGKMSIKQIFEKNGTRGNEIYRHPHFVPYLRYFIEGPDILDVHQIKLYNIREEGYFQDDIISEIYKYLLDNTLIPKDNSEKKYFVEEIFKLTNEMKLDLRYCKQLREKIMRYR